MNPYIKLKNRNSLEVIPEVDSKSIIYLDPMFGIENKSFAKKRNAFFKKISSGPAR